MKVIQYLLNDILPEDIRDYTRTYDKKSFNDMMTLVAEKHPDKYKEVMDSIVKITGDAVWYTGETVTLDDFKPLVDSNPFYARMENELDSIDKNIKNKTKRESAKQEIRERYSNLLEKATVEAAKKKGDNNLYNSVLSGARGNDFQFKAMVSTPALYTDHKDKTIPMFIKRSYGGGVSLPEYLAATFGTRKAMMTIKKGTANSGGLAKAMHRAVGDSVITSSKDTSNNAIDLDINDDSLYGRVLGRDMGGLKAGTVLDRNAINALQREKIDRVLVYSPLSTISKDSGMSSEAFGLDFNKKLPPIGFHAGLTATTALSEPFIQGSLSSKHNAGAFQGGKKTFSGYKYLNQFLSSPETYQDKAPIADDDGVVDSIREAPQGGTYITVNKKDYYVEPNTDIYVKAGDKVERGQQLSDGLLDPEEVTRISGIGEGRRVLTEVGKQILDDSGVKAHRRNMEVLARSYINKVEITNPDGLQGYNVGDVVPYNRLAANYEPDEKSYTLSLNDKNLTNKYLQKGVLHYTIGTKLTPSMIKRIKDSGITDEVLVTDDDVGFKPAYYRLSESSTKGTDTFLEKANASYQKSNYVESAIKGNETDIKQNVNPFVRVTFPNFADNVRTTGKF